MKKLNKKLAAIIIALVLTIALAVSASAADIGRVTGLKVSTVVNNSVALAWNTISAADGYRIQMRQNSGAWTTIAEEVQSNSYVVKNLQIGSTYSFKVSAYTINEVKIPILGTVISSEKKYGSYSTEVSVSHALGKVTGLKVASTTPTKVKLSWTKVADAEGYLVQKKVDGKWKNVKTTTSTSYTVTGLTPNSTTPFRVKAYVTVNGTKVYGSVSSTVNGKAAVPQVQNLKTTIKSLTSVQLTWTKVSNATGYQIYRKVGSGDWKKIKTISKNTTVTFTNSSLTTGTKYQYKIRAYYKTDSKTYYGAYSEVKSVTPTLPAVVGIDFNSFTTKNRAVITWDKVSGAKGYQVYDFTSGKGVKVATVTANKATVSIEDNKIAKFKVRAYTTVSGKTVTGAYSDIFEIYATPSKVMNLDYEALADESIRLYWDKVDIAHGYKIEVINNSTAKWQAYAISADNYFTITDTASLPGTNFRVSAFVKNDTVSLYGETSNIITAKIIKKPDIFEGNTTKNSITLTWTSINDATTYVLEKYSFEEDAWKVLKETYETLYTDKSDSGMSGMYRVYAKNPDGSRSSASDAIIAYTDGISVTQDGAAQTITWPAVEGASKYRIYVKSTYGDRGYLGTIINANTNSATVSLTPDSLQSLIIHAYSADGSHVGCAVDELLIKTEKFKTFDQNHIHYNHSINSQLLYLVEAINKTKHETGTVTVSASSAVTYNTEKFFVNNTSFSGSNVQGLLTFINTLTGFNKDSGDVKDITFSGTETSKETLTFEDCIAKNTEGKSVNLAKYIDPSDEDSAYLYASNDPAAWKDGVKSLSVAPTSNGGYKYVMVLYKEEYGSETNVNQAYYHNGFATTIASFNVLSSTELDNQLTSVGDTTITAVINADGTLESYQVSSPYSMKVKSPVNGIMGINSFGMQISGNVSSLYTFKR